MRFLANENFPGDAVAALRVCGHDVVWIRTDSPGISDVEVLKRAQRETRIIVTFDKDFGELAFRQKLPARSGIILFRISVPSSHAPFYSRGKDNIKTSSSFNCVINFALRVECQLETFSRLLLKNLELPPLTENRRMKIAIAPLPPGSESKVQFW